MVVSDNIGKRTNQLTGNARWFKASGCDIDRNSYLYKLFIHKTIKVKVLQWYWCKMERRAGEAPISIQKNIMISSKRC
jgi:hypothetical protein